MHVEHIKLKCKCKMRDKKIYYYLCFEILGRTKIHAEQH